MGIDFVAASSESIDVVRAAAAWRGSNNWTLSCIIDYDLTPAALAKIIDDYDGFTGMRRSFQLGLLSSDKFNIYWSTDGANVFSVSSANAFSADTLYHVCIINNTTTIKMYINGVEEGSAASPTCYDPGSSVPNFRYGMQINTAAAQYDGSLANVKIFNRGITLAELKILSESRGNDKITTGVALHHPMLEGVGGSAVTNLVDLSGNGHTVSVNNAPDWIAMAMKSI